MEGHHRRPGADRAGPESGRARRVHRGRAALAPADGRAGRTSRDQVVVDFHTHTNRSHDVAGTAMRDYDVASNLRWHRRAGFDAAFITDHNTVGPLAAGEGLAIGCPGIEVSAWRAHIVLLGDSVPVDRSHYNRDLAGLLEFLRSTETEYGALSVASIPEYVRNHWGRLDTLVVGRARRFRDRQRCSQGQRDHPGPARHGHRARPPNEPLRRRRERPSRLGSDQHGLEPGRGTRVADGARAGLRRRSPPDGRRLRIGPDRRAPPPPARQRMAGDSHSPGRPLGDLAEHRLDGDTQPGSSGSGGPGRSCGYGAALGPLKLLPPL